MNAKAEEVDSEEVETAVLTRWEKCLQWFGMIKTFFTLEKIVWGLIAVGGTAVMVGEATDTKPIWEAAVSIGLLEERPKDILEHDVRRVDEPD